MRINPIAKALGLLGALSFATYSFAAETRTVTLEAGESPISYTEVLEAIGSESPWSEGEFFSLEIKNSKDTGAAYVTYGSDYADTFDASVFTGTDSEDTDVVIYPQDLNITSKDVGILFGASEDEAEENVGSLSIGCDVTIDAATAVSQAEGAISLLSFIGTTPEGYEDVAFSRPTVKITGDYTFSNGNLLFDSVDATLIGQGEIGVLALGQSDTEKATELHITDSPTRAKRTFLRIGELELAQGTMTLSGSGDGTIVQAKTLSVESSELGGTIHIKDGAAFVLGDFTITQEESEAGEVVIRYLGDVYEMKGSSRPTLVINQTIPVVSGDASELTIKVGTVNSITSNSEDASGGTILVGSDARLVLFYQPQTQDASLMVASMLLADEGEPSTLGTSTLTISREPGAQLVISGWDGTTSEIDLDWEPENVSFSATVLGRAQVVRTDTGLRVERRYMQNVAGLKSYNAVKVAEDGLYAGTLSSAGVELIRAAINESNLGDLAFVDLVDSTVFLPLASGLHVLTERAFDSAHTQMMTRSMARTTERDHWWVSANRETHRIPNMGLKGKVTSVLLGADRSLTANWSASVAVGGSKIDSTQSGLVYGIKGDTAFANASIFAERELPGDSKLRLGVTVGRAELTTKRTVLGHTVKSEPVIKMFGVGARYSTSYTGQKTSITPFIGLNGYTAKFSDGDVTDQGEFSGVHGAGFKTTAKKRIWGDVTAGFTADATWEPFVDCFVRPRMALLGKVAFGDRKWKAASTLATQTSAPDYDTFQSTPLWSVAAEIGLNIAASKKVPIKEGGFLGFGGEDTGKDAMKDWQFDLKIGYRRAEKSEHSSYIGFEYRENW